MECRTLIYQFLLATNNFEDNIPLAIFGFADDIALIAKNKNSVGYMI